MTRRWMILAVSTIALASLIAVEPAHAHHAVTPFYDLTKTVEFDGIVTRWVFKNPHSFVTIQAPDDKGTMQRWSLEWSGTGQLTGAGVTRESLKAGDELEVVANPSRVSGELKALMVSLKRPLDGFAWGGRGGQVVD